MDSAKNKKLFPELSSPVADSAVSFGLPMAFWDMLDSDPDWKSEFHARVEARARALLAQDETAKQVLEGARDEAFQKGLEENREKVTSAIEKLERIAEAFIAKQDTFLASQEKQWCEALARLAKRFLMPLSAERLKNLSDWLRETVGDLGRQTKIRVFLAPTVFKQIEQAASQQAVHWEWAEDKGLSEGDLRVELGSGGMFFSTQEQWERFEGKLKEILESP